MHCLLFQGKIDDADALRLPVGRSSVPDAPLSEDYHSVDSIMALEPDESLARGVGVDGLLR